MNKHMSISRVERIKHVGSKVIRYNKKFQTDRQSFDVWYVAWKGFEATRISICLIPDWRWLMNLIRSQAVGITSETAVYKRVRFRSCGTVGYGPTMWVKTRKVAQSCKQGMSEDSMSVMSVTTWVPRARDEENHFPARWTRRANRQSSRPSVATGMSSTTVTGSCWQNCTTEAFT